LNESPYIIYTELLLIPLLINSLNITKYTGSSVGVTKRDKRINPAKGIAQMVAAKKKVITNAIKPSRRIPYFRMMNQVPMKQTIVQARIE
jgi:hypothetical protein